MMVEEKKNKKMAAGVAAKEGYEASVAARALHRAGHCPQLKGHVHEIMFCDKYNANPLHMAQGNHMELTKSATAMMKDVVVKNSAGRVVGHAQLKDTVSSTGAAKTAKQILDGHYNKTRVFGTKETAAKVGAKLTGKTAQEIHSSGISFSTTTRIAGRALGKMPTAEIMGSALKSGGAAGAASSAASAAAAGAVGTAAAAAAGTAIASTAVGAAAITAAPVVVPFAAACLVGSFLSDLFDF